MAPFYTKFRLWIVLSVAFISLSVLANPVQQLEGHRCYWCGPLAEQVHRSQRAAKCNGDKSKVTICDEDLPYCAIVASSPPYVESRYCVKFYQDECYPLYCNTTKIWKVICPCRGELCNGPNTKRENEVFEALHKLTQTQRLKRALISNGGFLGVITSRNKTNNVDQNVDAPNDDVRNKENENAANSIIESADNDKHYTDKISEMDPTVNLVTLQAEVLTSLNFETPNVKVSFSDNVEITSNESTETTKAVAVEHSETTAATVTATFLETAGAETSSVASNIAVTTPADNNSVDTTTTASNVEVSTITNEDTVPKDTSQTNNTNTVNVAGVESNKNEANKLIEIPISGFDSDDLKIDTHVMSSDHPKPVNDMDIKTEIIASMQTNTTETKPTTEATTTKETTEIEKSNQAAINLENAKSKSSENLPPAEALQHNDAPATKTMERMNTSSTTVMSLLNTHMAQTTLPTIPRNNTATRMDAQLLTMIIGLVLQY